MAAEPRRERRNSNSQLLQELDALSQTLYHPNSNPARRTASLALPRSVAAPPPQTIPIPDHSLPVVNAAPTRSRRLSMSPFRSRQKSHQEPDNDDDDDGNDSGRLGHRRQPSLSLTSSKNKEEKKGIWGWKPMRALAHMRMQRLSCLFSVEVVAIQGLPPSMNGLRLCVTVRKKESKDGAVQTMPARVLQGCADFEETLFVRCHVFCSGKPLKFEPRPFLISAVAVDAPELDFGKSSVDLSLMVQESVERSSEGARIRQWDAEFPLAGKAKGGELVVKLGFQIMEDGGVEIYKQGAIEGGARSSSSTSSLFARRQSKSSFSVSSPKIGRAEARGTPKKETGTVDLRGIDDFKLDEPSPSPPAQPPPVKSKVEDEKEEQKQDDLDLDLPEFDVIDRGVEVQEEVKNEEEKQEEEQEEAEAESAASASSEVVKEVVHDSAHLARLTELDAIAMQIKALESMVADDTKPEPDQQEDDQNHGLDADEETVTREFLQMLEMEDDGDNNNKELISSIDDIPDFANLPKPEETSDGETKCYLSDLGKGLGSVVQTRDGGYLAAMNPFDTEVRRKETPKLAMQVSKPVILKNQKLGSGIEVFQKLAAMGPDKLALKLASLAAMDELAGKTAEQIAFEGIASAIISGRNKELGASSSAAKSVATLKAMSSSMSEGRKERITTGIWNMKEEPVVVEDILPLSLQKIEVMAVDALKLQVGVADELEAPFDVSPLAGKEYSGDALDSSVSVKEWDAKGSGDHVTMMVVVQLRDPMRRYETVGGPMVVVVQVARVVEEMYKVESLHVGGMKSGEKQRLTAMQWVVAQGMWKAAGKRSRNAKVGSSGQGSIWSISSRVMADMWLKPMRNPDVKFVAS